jgi:hypothetical protein
MMDEMQDLYGVAEAKVSTTPEMAPYVQGILAVVARGTCLRLARYLAQ